MVTTKYSKSDVIVEQDLLRIYQIIHFILRTDPYNGSFYIRHKIIFQSNTTTTKPVLIQVLLGFKWWSGVTLNCQISSSRKRNQRTNYGLRCDTNWILTSFTCGTGTGRAAWQIMAVQPHLPTHPQIFLVKNFWRFAYCTVKTIQS